jgi:hypothetical protein
MELWSTSGQIAPTAVLVEMTVVVTPSLFVTKEGVLVWQTAVVALFPALARRVARGVWTYKQTPGTVVTVEYPVGRCSAAFPESAGITFRTQITVDRTTSYARPTRCVSSPNACRAPRVLLSVLTFA